MKKPLMMCAGFAAIALFAGTADSGPIGLRQSDLLQTKAIQSAIDRVAAGGGGEAVIPEGRYRTGGLVLRSGVTLRLAEGAELEADRDPDDYPGSNRWYRALIRADGAQDVGIVGGRHSTINGMNCFDGRGEEGFRGPHAIMFLNCTNVTLGGYTVRDSANWGHAIFHCKDVTVRNVRVYGGHDAFDFHDSENVDVAACEFRTVRRRASSTTATRAGRSIVRNATSSSAIASSKNLAASSRSSTTDATCGAAAIRWNRSRSNGARSTA